MQLLPWEDPIWLGRHCSPAHRTTFVLESPQSSGLARVGELPGGDVISAQEEPPKPEGLSGLGPSSSPQPGLSLKTTLYLLMAANPYLCLLCQGLEERRGHRGHSCDPLSPLLPLYPSHSPAPPILVPQACCLRSYQDPFISVFPWPLALSATSSGTLESSRGENK